MKNLKNNVKRILAMMVAVAVMFTAAPAVSTEAAASNRYVQITATNGVNVHSGPSTANSRIGGLKKGDSARVVSWVGQYIEIEFQGGVGYIQYNTSWEKLVWGDPNAGNTGTSTPQTIVWYNLGANYIAECITSSLRVHTKADINAPVSGYLTDGQYVTATAESLRWVEIKYYNNAGDYETGYVYRSYVSLAQKAQYSGETFWNKTGTVRIDVNGLFVHDKPALTKDNVYNCIANLNQTYKVFAESEHWYKILYKSSYKYIIKEYATYFAKSVKVKLSDTSIAMDKGDSVKLWVTKFKSTKKALGIKSVKFTSSNRKVARATKINKSKGSCYVKGYKAGTAKIYFKYRLTGSSKWKSVKCTVRVSSADINVASDAIG